MHPVAVKEIVALCRKRDAEGDCPSVELPGKETLEFCILDLAGQLDRERNATLVHLVGALRKVSPRGLDQIVSDFNAYKTLVKARDEAFEDLLALLRTTPAESPPSPPVPGGA